MVHRLIQPGEDYKTESEQLKLEQNFIECNNSIQLYNKPQEDAGFCKFRTCEKLEDTEGQSLVNSCTLSKRRQRET